jgi:cytochrome c oxidase subunit 4
MSGHVVPIKIYVAIFLALMLLTALTVWVAFQDLGVLNNVAALGIATLKAALVVLYFMHVRYSSRVISLVVMTGFACLAILLILTLSDYGSRGWLPFPGK